MSPRPRKPPQKTNDPTQISTATTATMTPPAESRPERIAQRAYAIYERRGNQDGSPMEDWLQAEREIDDEA